MIQLILFSVEKSSWTRPPLENSNDGRIPRTEPLTANVPRVIDNSNYRNYLKKRYPRIAQLQDEMQGMTTTFETSIPSPSPEMPKPPSRQRSRKPKAPPPPTVKRDTAKNEVGFRRVWILLSLH